MVDGHKMRSVGSFRHYGILDARPSGAEGMMRSTTIYFGTLLILLGTCGRIYMKRLYCFEVNIYIRTKVLYIWICLGACGRIDTF